MKKKNTYQIPHIIQISEVDYQKYLFERFWKWCQIHAGTIPYKEQFLVANPAVSKWFFNEISKCEREFMIIVTLLKKPDRNTLIIQLKICLDQINKIYPSALVECPKTKNNYTIKRFTNIYPN